MNTLANPTLMDSPVLNGDYLRQYMLPGFNEGGETIEAQPTEQVRAQAESDLAARNIAFRQRFRSDALLLITALVWGSAFVPQRIATANLGPFLFNGLRFLLAAALLLPWVRPFRWPAPSVVRWTLTAGLLLAAGSTCQQAGLRFTTAGNAAFLTTLYVVLVPLVTWIGFRQKTGVVTLVGALIAAVGTFLLSADNRLQLNGGDKLEIFGALLWAMHVVVVGRAMQHVPVFLFSVGQFLVAGIVTLALGIMFESQTLPGLTQCWWAVVYVGVFSVALGYTLQAVGQKHAPAADAAIIFSAEAVFAAIFAYFQLGETLSPRQLIGCAMILAASLLVQFKPVDRDEKLRTLEDLSARPVTR